MKWVMQQIVHLTRMNWWVGLRLKNHHWTWEDGTLYDRNLVHWERNLEGNTGAADGCGNMYGYPPNLGNLTVQNCNYGMGIICKRSVDLLDFCDQINDWHYLSGSCWKYFNQQMNWYDARATCQHNGGDLLVPPDYQSEQNLWELIPCHTAENRAWIGVSDTARPGQWLSINNNSLRFAHWNSFPIQILQAGQTCAVADPVNNLGWDTELCTSSFTFVCNRTLGSCPNGWLSHGDRCYQVIDVPTSRKTYFDALQYCSQRGTSLLVINR
ncbi:hypothetical protein CHS0354_017012 [Potamilus streckersoni]|uniref:C-type lectin domain-containing protein n=1 Tax=Potamilus streckersoni TaxID=2493646 RepID=A0AAE0SM76_9BIVA|nr:hypothetical protein CHS0354_017012 [Potamilus streckersoni]